MDFTFCCLFDDDAKLLNRPPNHLLVLFQMFQILFQHANVVHFYYYNPLHIRRKESLLPLYAQMSKAIFYRG